MLAIFGAAGTYAVTGFYHLVDGQVIQGENLHEMKAIMERVELRLSEVCQKVDAATANQSTLSSRLSAVEARQGVMEHTLERIEQHKGQ